MRRKNEAYVFVSDDEKKLARDCKTFAEFSTKYVSRFGAKISLHGLPKRVYRVWNDYHDVAPIVSKPKQPQLKQPQPSDSLPDTARILVDILNEIRLLRVQVDEFSGLKNCGVALSDVHDIMKKVAAKQREIDGSKKVA
jgi:hypothetical protein